MELRTRSAAHEAQRLFFQIGMEQRVKVGAQLGELGLSFAQAHALRMLDPEEPLPMSALAELRAHFHALFHADLEEQPLRLVRRRPRPQLHDTRV